MEKLEVIGALLHADHFAAGLERSVPVRPHFLPSADGNRPGSPPARNCFQ
jgi:hypothetical protein